MENALADLPLRLRRPARLLRLAGDERLVALVRSGDEGAFEALYDRHHPAILGFCRHMLGSREEAEDAVQHTFLAAFRDLVGSEKPIELRPWLFAIARNRCLSLLRARRAHVSIELAEPATDGLAATVERREDLRELLTDLADLPEDQRAALLLAELGALDHVGIATVLGCPREKVKALVFQARTSLAASREARATPCEDIRMELATASGAALRRGPLRRHLRTCDGCRAFKAEVATQHKLMALALPVVPSVALKASVIGGSSGGGASVSSGLLGAVTSSTSAGKLALSLVAVGAVAGGGALTTHLEHGPTPATHAAPVLNPPYADPGSPLSTGERVRHRATSRLPADGDPAATGRRVLAPTVVRTAEANAGAPGIVPTPASGPGPESTPAPVPAPAAAEPPATPPPHAQGTHPGTTPPGQSQTPPGQSRNPPGQSRNPYGRTKAPHGQSVTPPGQSKAPGTSGPHDGGSGNGNPPASPGTPSPGPPASPPGQGQSSPPGQGQSSPPGQGQSSPPGQSGASPGQSGSAPGQSGAPHGHAG